MSYCLNSLKGSYIGKYIEGSYYRSYSGGILGLDYGSYQAQGHGPGLQVYYHYLGFGGVVSLYF